MNPSYAEMAKMIDHSLLPPQLTERELEAGIDVALAYDVASVCIMPYYLRRCAQRLAGSTVRASTTIGFPHGGHRTSVKRAEAIAALEDGCEELDVVVNISQVVSGNWGFVTDDLAAVIEVAHDAGQKVKVIFENCYLDDLQKIRLCEICTTLKADWVKTSTGFGTGGATEADLILMRRHAGPAVQVKAAGGVRDYAALCRVRELGATRCGSSKTQILLDQCRQVLGLPPIDKVSTDTNSRPAQGY